MKLIIKTITVVCFIGLIPLLALALARIFRFEDSGTIIVAETVTIYLLLPAYAIFVFALVVRERQLAVLAGFLALCHIFWFTPELLHHRAASAEKLASASRFTLFSQNVMFDNPTPQAVGKEIISTNADVVMLQEFSQRDYAAMNQQGVFAAYPYSFVKTSYGPEGLGIFSKYPLSEQENVASPGFPQQRAVANVNGKQLTLWNVHIRAPVDGPPTNWLGGLKQLKSRIHQETDATLVAGDFNATFGHRPYRELLNNGYHEAAIDVGRGYSRTWPANGKASKSTSGFVRLDHVLYNRGIIATQVREVPGNGSDHRGVVARLALF